MKFLKLILIIILTQLIFNSCVFAQEEILLEVDKPLKLAIQEVPTDLEQEKATETEKNDPEYGNLNQKLFTKEEEKIDEVTIPPKIITAQKYGVPTVLGINLKDSLLHEHLTHKFKEGPMEEISIFGAYRGAVSANFYDSDYSTEFDNNVMEIGIIGDFKELPMDYKIIFNLAASSDDKNYLKTLISDSFITYKGIPHHSIVIGNSRTPVGIEGSQSSYILPLLSRAQISRNFGSIRARGIKVIGNYDLVDYNLAFSSSDRFYTEFAPGVEFTGWVNFKPLGKTKGKYGNLIIGTGLNAGHNDFNYTVGGAYVGYEYKKFSINCEAAIADGYNGLVQSENKAWGLYSTLAYKITDKLQLVARYDQFTPNRDENNNTIKEYTAGLNYYLKGEALRFILNYVYRQNPQGENSNRVLFATQIIL